MGVDQLLGAFFALVLVSLAIGGLRKGSFSGPSGLAYIVRAERPYLFWIFMLLHLLGAAAALLVFL